MSLLFQAVIFKRGKSSPWEEGVIINGDHLIVDLCGDPVPAPVWSYEVHGYHLTLSYVESGAADHRNKKAK